MQAEVALAPNTQTCTLRALLDLGLLLDVQVAGCGQDHIRPAFSPASVISSALFTYRLDDCTVGQPLMTTWKLQLFVGFLTMLII